MIPAKRKNRLRHHQFTDKRRIIQHNVFGSYLPWCEFFKTRGTV